MSHCFDYSSKRVVITGAYSGVGAALLDVLSELGRPEVIALDLKEPDGPVDRFIETNLGDPSSLEDAIARIDGPIDALFNNAGIAATHPVEDVMAVNWLGLRQLSERLLPKIREDGAIANTASIAGGQWPGHLPEVLECIAIRDREELFAWCRGHPELVGDGYAFSKECVQVHTMKSAKETLARQVRTNSVCPGPIDTPLLPDFNKTISEKTIQWTIEQSGGTIATPRDIAMSLAFLGSHASRYVNGVNLNVDMGFSAFMTTGQLDFSGLARDARALEDPPTVSQGRDCPLQAETSGEWSLRRLFDLRTTASSDDPPSPASSARTLGSIRVRPPASAIAAIGSNSA